jgi:hypothetical protein
VFTKNLVRPPLEKHAAKFVGVDKYMSPKQGRASESGCSINSKEFKIDSNESGVGERVESVNWRVDNEMPRLDQGEWIQDWRKLKEVQTYVAAYKGPDLDCQRI